MLHVWLYWPFDDLVKCTSLVMFCPVLHSRIWSHRLVSVLQTQIIKSSEPDTTCFLSGLNAMHQTNLLCLSNGHPTILPVDISQIWTILSEDPDTVYVLSVSKATHQMLAVSLEQILHTLTHFRIPNLNHPIARTRENVFVVLGEWDGVYCVPEVLWVSTK